MTRYVRAALYALAANFGRSRVRVQPVWKYSKLGAGRGFFCDARDRKAASRPANCSLGGRDADNELNVREWQIKDQELHGLALTLVTKATKCLKAFDFWVRS